MATLTLSGTPMCADRGASSGLALISDVAARQPGSALAVLMLCKAAAVSHVDKRNAVSTLCHSEELGENSWPWYVTLSKQDVTDAQYAL